MMKQTRGIEIVFCMRLPIELCSLLVIFSSVFISSCKAEKTETNSALTKTGVAYVLEQKGTVLVREFGESIYKKTKKDMNLVKFSTLYTGPDGLVTLAYVGRKSAAVSIPPNSIYRLENELPITSLLRKGFTRSKFDMLQSQISSAVVQKDSTVVVSGVQDIGELKIESSEKASSGEQVKAVRFGIRMSFEMERIPIIFPLSNLFLSFNQESRTAIAPIEFGKKKNEDLQAFVWMVRPRQDVVWNGLISKTTKRIKLTLGKPGTYIFQAFGIDGKSRTRSVRIVVTPESDKNVLFPSGIIAGDTVIFN